MGIKYWERRKQLNNAKGWHWVADRWEWFGNGEYLDDFGESCSGRAKYSSYFSPPIAEKDMVIEVLTENEGWAIIYLHEKYFIKHLACDTILRHNAKNGCFCHQKVIYDCKCFRKNKYCPKPECRTEPPKMQVDPIIYSKWRIMTLREEDLKGKV